MIDFTVLVLPGAFPSSVTLTLDILTTAAAGANKAGCAAPQWRVYAPTRTVRLQHGLSLQAQVLPKKPACDGSTWIVPGLGTTNADALLARLAAPDARRAQQALQAHAAAGGRIAAACSAVFLLQAAGLLAGKTVTTSWWFAALLQQLEPRCVVDADRMVIDDGALITAGAAFAQTDLLMHLLRTRFSPALADAVARALLIDGRQSQAPFIVPTLLAGGNELVARLITRFEAALPQPPSIAELAAELCLSERTLSRHIRAATGRSTSALLQHVRLNQARHLLETSTLSVEQIAERVGYDDTTALRRLMRKVLGATPRQFRPAVTPAKIEPR